MIVGARVTSIEDVTDGSLVSSRPIGSIAVGTRVSVAVGSLVSPTSSCVDVSITVGARVAAAVGLVVSAAPTGFGSSTLVGTRVSVAVGSLVSKTSSCVGASVSVGTRVDSAVGLVVSAAPVGFDASTVVGAREAGVIVRSLASTASIGDVTAAAGAGVATTVGKLVAASTTLFSEVLLNVGRIVLNSSETEGNIVFRPEGAVGVYVVLSVVGDTAGWGMSAASFGLISFVYRVVHG